MIGSCWPGRGGGGLIRKKQGIMCDWSGFMFDFFQLVLNWKQGQKEGMPSVTHHFQAIAVKVIV